MTTPKTRPYITQFNGQDRLVEAKSREQVRDHLLAPILKNITPPLDTIVPANAGQVARLMKAGVPYEEAGAQEEELLTFEELEDSMILHATVEVFEQESDWTGIVSLIAVDEGFQLENTAFTVRKDGLNKYPIKLRRLTDEERQTFLDLPQK